LLNYGKDGAELKEKLQELTGGRLVDVCYEVVGGAIFTACVRAMAGQGRLLVVGFASGSIPNFPINLALVKGFSVVGVRSGAELQLDPKMQAETEAALAQLAPKLKPLVERVFPWEELPAALRMLADRQALGKVVVAPPKAKAKL